MHIQTERKNFMIYVGIDVGKLSHHFVIIDNSTGEVLCSPEEFRNDAEGFHSLVTKLDSYPKDSIRIGMEDTGHYHFNLLKYLFSKGFTVALVNPRSTDLQRKLEGGITKTDKLDTYTICQVLCTIPVDGKVPYRIVTKKTLELYDQKQLTRQHHNLKEEQNVYRNRLQKSIDITFPEYNSLFKSKYGIVYMSVLKKFPSAASIASTDIRTLRKCFNNTGKGNRIKLTAEELKEAAKESVGFESVAEELTIQNLIAQIELIESQVETIDQKIREFSTKTNSPILSIPGISHFSGTSILAEIGDIGNYSKPSQIIKMAGVAPLTYESSQYQAQHTAITKKGSKYLRKTLYQIILPVIEHNDVFKQYYDLKRSQGKSHLCAEGHCIRKLLRVIYQLLKTNQDFNPELLR